MLVRATVEGEAVPLYTALAGSEKGPRRTNMSCILGIPFDEAHPVEVRRPVP